MINLQVLVNQKFISEIQRAYESNYGLLEPEYASILAWSANLALENISNSDALYHNVDHTMMATFAAQEIIRGKHLKEGGVSPEDWMHYILAILFHDIGYVKGVCGGDRVGDFIYSKGVGDETIKLGFGSTDAALTPYHVDRSKQFVLERFAQNKIINAERVAKYIEFTRFPVPDDADHKDTKGLAGLTRAADFIGQLGDPNYMRKIPALFYEFVENDVHTKIGYNDPGDMRKNYAKFFWDSVSPFIQDALGYLWITQEGKQWISSLHAHVFVIEHLED
ncbi:MAG: hypothetical protein K9J12_05630 [Melioribacteraceae bacterium]|nr:hypothetical protein [Melioribacteraceae bacterium]MCF8264273.1 hypothetical protein [Melioribacteraceae bacterium]MCF8413405.1 hypothetical protein [Melioribacteraceae bacterium]